MQVERQVEFKFVDESGSPPTTIVVGRHEDGSVHLVVVMEHERSATFPLIQTQTTSIGMAWTCPNHGPVGTMSRAGLRDFLRSALVLVEGDA